MEVEEPNSANCDITRALQEATTSFNQRDAFILELQANITVKEEEICLLRSAADKSEWTNAGRRHRHQKHPSKDNNTQSPLQHSDIPMQVDEQQSCDKRQEGQVSTLDSGNKRSYASAAAS